MSRDEFLVEDLDANVLGVKVMVGAMTIGAAFFLGVVLFLDLPAGESETTVAAAAACIAVVLRIALPPVGKRVRDEVESALRNRNEGGADQLLIRAYRGHAIVNAARFEGAALFSLVAYMLEGQPLALGIGILMIAAVAAHIPSRKGVVGWMEDQRRRLRA